MIAYEIKLRYVIRDKIQSKTKSSLRQNSVQDKIQSKTKSENFFHQKKNFCWGNFVRIENSQILSWTEFCLRFPVRFFHELSGTNRCLSLSDTYIPQ